MNKKGIEYIASSNLKLKKHIDENKLKFTHPSADEIYERCMRLGVEERSFDLTSHEDMELIAIASLKNDFVKYSYRLT